MEKDSGHKLKELAVDGGMSNSDLCMQVRQARERVCLFGHVANANMIDCHRHKRT